MAMPPSRLAAMGHEMSMYWDERSHRDPAQQWLRAYIAGVLAA